MKLVNTEILISSIKNQEVEFVDLDTIGELVAKATREISFTSFIADLKYGYIHENSKYDVRIALCQQTDNSFNFKAKDIKTAKEMDALIYEYFPCLKEIDDKADELSTEGVTND